MSLKDEERKKAIEEEARKELLEDKSLKEKVEESTEDCSSCMDTHSIAVTTEEEFQELLKGLCDGEPFN
ncbi:hypothetical protein D3H64_07625 [Atopobacter sp. AH10]|uniref:hypothetical protein n=1 Tax=Atopobacter sp. AH10 TaxID=2315861 RepID=UPI000EF244F5|nr:hypothetical protein [Atopobacter sp. AH10]RLK62802.1 hypothetical protein D3H64_07625 [Atopobacter sp. AH10]